MTGICSAHKHNDPNCKLCQVDISEILPDYDEKVKEAKAKGLYKCDCGFEYYKTVNACPLCGEVRKEDK